MTELDLPEESTMTTENMYGNVVLKSGEIDEELDSDVLALFDDDGPKTRPAEPSDAGSGAKPAVVESQEPKTLKRAAEPSADERPAKIRKTSAEAANRALTVGLILGDENSGGKYIEIVHRTKHGQQIIRLDNLDQRTAESWIKAVDLDECTITDGISKRRGMYVFTVRDGTVGVKTYIAADLVGDKVAGIFKMLRAGEMSQ